jgi:hypothetical protein
MKLSVRDFRGIDKLELDLTDADGEPVNLAVLAGDAWMRSFSGKEIFRYLRSHVRGLDEAPVRPPNPTAAERDLNLGKRVARQMNEMRRIPPKLAELHRVVRTKAGI